MNMKTTSMIGVAMLAASLNSVQAVEIYSDDKQRVELTGRVYVGHVMADEDTAKHDNFGNNHYLRLGAKGRSVITDDISAIGRYELEWQVAEDGEQDTTKTRLAYAGLRSKVGEITFGRNYGAMKLISNWTDTSFVDEYGNDALGVGKADGMGRTSGLFKYAGQFSGLDLQASYKLNNKTGAGSDNSASGIALAYQWQGFGIAAGYNVQKDSNNPDKTLALVGVKFDGKRFWTAASMAKGENIEGVEHTGYEAALGFKLTKALGIQAMLNTGTEKRSVGAVDTDFVDYYTLGARYKLSKKPVSYTHLTLPTIYPV